MKQVAFKLSTRTKHGGVPTRGRRKLSRPWVPKLPLHVIMRSDRARGPRSMLSHTHRTWIDDSVRDHARKHGIQLYRFANVGNHLHFVLLAPTRDALRAFIRGIAGKIALRLRNGRDTPASKAPFFDSLPFSRIVQWGRDFAGVCDYIGKNWMEAMGISGQRAREAWKWLMTEGALVVSNGGCVEAWAPKAAMIPR